MRRIQETENTNSIGQLIKSYRKFKGKSQQDIGEVLNVSVQQVQKYENGKNRISANSLLKISEYLKIPIIEFFPNSKGNHFFDIETIEQEDYKLLYHFKLINNRAFKNSIIKFVEEATKDLARF